MSGRVRVVQDLIVALADSIGADSEQRDLPRMLAAGVSAVLKADAAVLLYEVGSLTVAATEGADAAELAAVEVASGSGPSIDCFSDGEAVSCVDLPRTLNWPQWSGPACEAGVTAVYTRPMRRRQQRIGVLTLLKRGGSPLRESGELSTAQALADAATVGLLHQRLLRRQALVSAQLRSALESRVLIEQAKGVLAERSGVGLEESFRMLRGYARNHGRKIHEVAAEVITGSLRISADTAARRPPEA